jgi:hypothetical protein
MYNVGGMMCSGNRLDFSNEPCKQRRVSIDPIDQVDYQYQIRMVDELFQSLFFVSQIINGHEVDDVKSTWSFVMLRHIIAMYVLVNVCEEITVVSLCIFWAK